MIPLISVIRHRRKRVEYLEERFRGRQFRCTKCNRLFPDEAEVERHAASENARSPSHPELPRPDTAISIRLPYLADLKQMLGERRRRKRDG